MLTADEKKTIRDIANRTDFRHGDPDNVWQTGDGYALYRYMLYQRGNNGALYDYSTIIFETSDFHEYLRKRQEANDFVTSIRRHITAFTEDQEKRIREIIVEILGQSS